MINIYANVTSEWYWEGNVVEVIANALEKAGWIILSKADTHLKERGLDLHAVKGEMKLLVEAKGFPSASYRDPDRADERKSTNPSNQAQHWYAQALLKAMRLQTKHPNTIVAVGLPDFRRYRSLFAETRTAIEKLGLAVLFVSETGDVADPIGLPALGWASSPPLSGVVSSVTSPFLRLGQKTMLEQSHLSLTTGAHRADTRREQIKDFLQKNKRQPYCDDCLAQKLHFRRQQAQQVTSSLGFAYRRQQRECNGCGRPKLSTCTV